ncbi:MAG: hypothetical protein MK213_05490, partial [Planctomycetes bacterium]|nr:hypothetical protein [Planctomycetota bacterium]
KVPRKYWRPEYADIVPTYVRTLHEGFLRAYDDIREERNLKPSDKVNRFMLSTDAKEEIWKKAIDAAWGAIDMEEFEEKWVGYITKGVR